jgi:hypothetical protein
MIILILTLTYNNSTRFVFLGCFWWFLGHPNRWLASVLLLPVQHGLCGGFVSFEGCLRGLSRGPEREKRVRRPRTADMQDSEDSEDDEDWEEEEDSEDAEG